MLTEKDLEKFYEYYVNIAEPECSIFLNEYKSDTWDNGNYLTCFKEEIWECDLCNGYGTIEGKILIRKYGCPLDCPFDCDECPFEYVEITCPSCGGEGKIIT